MIILFFLIIISGCKKNTIDNTFDTKSEMDGISINEARNWYENSENNSRVSASNIVAISPSSISKLNINIKNVDWNKGRQSSDSKYYVIEFLIILDKSLGFQISQDKNKDISNVNGLTKLLILKNRKTSDKIAILMHVYGENGNADNNFVYKHPGNNFSGYVFYTDLSGNFANGWKYEKGKIIKKSENNKMISNLRAPRGSKCETEVTNIYERTCYYENGLQIWCTEWRLIDTVYQSFCPPGDDGGGGGFEENDVDKILDNMLDASPASDIISIDLTQLGLQERTKVYRWKCYTAPTYDLISIETGVHKKVSNPDPKLQWQWKSLTHTGLFMDGMVLGGTLNYTLASAYSTLGLYNAIMEVQSHIKATSAGPFPVTKEKLLPPVHRNFNVND